mmetsp:Transcript_50155/g.68522  ORF Transcript_50155/g.68522 Transcript_50155/m.68522 type:complete len:586 (-) Transcript_50155:1434-3191(-)
MKVLDNFSAEFEMGKTTAIVGPSGSGKSTIVQLIERFYDPSEGAIIIDGNDLRNINLKNFRRQVGYVNQEPILFNTSIKKNILFGNPTASDNEIKLALKASNAWGFIRNKKDGINLMVGTSGGQLSGGQKQRIAIARAFIKKPKILIFDEATSALDKKNEAEVQKSIDSIRKELGQVTTVVIAHRLSTVRNADTILVMKKGKVIEKGNHDSLLKDFPTGLYAKLVHEQDNAEDGNAANQPDFANELEEQIDEVENQETDTGMNINKSANDPSNINASSNINMIASSQQLIDQDVVTGPKGNARSKSIASSRASMAIPESPEVIIMNKKVAKIDEEYDEEIKHRRETINKMNYMKRLGPYNTPTSYVVIGIITCICLGVIQPLFGVFMVDSLVAMSYPLYTPAFVEAQKEEIRKWTLAMFGAAAAGGLCQFCGKYYLAHVGENISMNMRSVVYNSIMMKQIGWHDDRDNAPGVLSNILSKEVNMLNGVSTEALAVIGEAGFALLFGVGMGFYFDWRIALCALAITPFQMIAGAISGKRDTGQGWGEYDEVAVKDANLLAGDAIANYRTVASFAHDDVIVAEFANLL